MRPGADKKIGSTKAKKKLDGSGYYWGFEKVGYSLKPSQKYTAKVAATATCGPATRAAKYKG